ncbi:cytochrome C biosynthesis protein [[Haemophilus] ducreyi]|uniref:Formate-dependent nitrite reductase complex subunit n=1 Tax=Haemophilus ducreyi TaxID=730 RepID=A0AAC8ZAF5_HAEDC|nr:heme lyase NrfEFG subunit NrfF [[Haemophilus] ducreyi]AKO30629.1 cytochrome C biosynthesis protein [[Haemophilus] ducreyi]AKO32066.1 cytochrome C biosynthesis protein [[Haemophilus] ducreyi]AKO33522.1 cytochrome C biosynthesis protein [[Haemophilus] ducreyi]AKO34968.1 cytochrome C biosynthesis protein [[Haemophilus] ducreyi]AKO36402.1 cytochrome C biosynthesis protein [[Haemophilus] ducreyi]
MKFLRKIICLLSAVFSLCVQAKMVDTFQFENNQDRLRAVALARSFRCTQCQNQNLVESNATNAYKIRLEVYEMVKQGKTDEEIIQIMTNRFGHFVHYKPPFNPHTWLLWGMPLALVLGLIITIIWRTKTRKV